MTYNVGMMKIMGAAVLCALCLLSMRRPFALWGRFQPVQCFLSTVPLIIQVLTVQAERLRFPLMYIRPPSNREIMSGCRAKTQQRAKIFSIPSENPQMYTSGTHSITLLFYKWGPWLSLSCSWIKPELSRNTHRRTARLKRRVKVVFFSPTKHSSHLVLQEQAPVWGGRFTKSFAALTFLEAQRRMGEGTEREPSQISRDGERRSYREKVEMKRRNDTHG